MVSVGAAIECHLIRRLGGWSFEGKVEKARCVRIFGEERCNCSIND